MTGKPTPKLKPCPFCGGEAKLSRNCHFAIICSKCKVDVFHEWEADCVITWNSRTMDENLVRALRDYLIDSDLMTVETRGKYPFSDAGCIECTLGAVPDKPNSGLCLYHLAHGLLAASSVKKTGYVGSDAFNVEKMKERLK